MVYDVAWGTWLIDELARGVRRVHHSGYFRPIRSRGFASRGSHLCCTRHARHKLKSQAWSGVEFRMQDEDA